MATGPRDGDGGSPATTHNGTWADDVWPVFEDFKSTSEWQQDNGSDILFEDFKPLSEWKRDNGSYILIIYLPGFVKEQIRVSTEGRNIIRVRGERPIAGNKWSCYLEDFQVPENSNMNSVCARFQGGILQITIPKIVIHKPPAATITLQPFYVDTPSQSDPETSDDEVPSPPPAADGKSSESQEKPFEDTPGEVEKRELENEKMTEEKEKMMERSKELPEDETTAQKGKESKQEQGIQTSRAENGASAMEKCKAVKGLAELNEEWQLLVNMGIAVLVIVSIIAYATYKFASGKDKN